MAHHTITEQEMDDWIQEMWFQFAASFSTESEKRLELSLNGLYRVSDHGSVRYIGGNKATAIKEYNAAL